MALGDRYVDDAEADWGGVGRAVAGSALSGIFLAIIGYLDAARLLLVDLLDGFSGWVSQFVPALIAPTGLWTAWRNAGESLDGLGPLGFIIAVGLTGIALWIGVSALIAVSRRLI
jgi:hypothetical protein